MVVLDGQHPGKGISPFAAAECRSARFARMVAFLLEKTRHSSETSTITSSRENGYGELFRMFLAFLGEYCLLTVASFLPSQQ